MKTIFSTAALTLFVAAATLPAYGQEAEIEIVNQDGELVDDAKLMLKAPSDPIEAHDQAAGNRQGINKAGGKITLQSNGEQITVTDADGNEQQIDLHGAQSVIVQQSTQTVNQNGKLETEVVGKAIVIDPDGKRHEIDLGDNGGDGLALPMMPKGFGGQLFTGNRNASKYMIGVHCNPVSPAMQAQLGLEEGMGLLVDAVGHGSPAEAAGLQKHDILLFADDRELIKQGDLVDVVQTAGEGNSGLTLTVMRGGKEISIEVSPIERPAEQMRVGFPRGAMGFGGFGKDFDDFEFKQIGPGVIIGGGFEEAMDDMRQQMERVQQQIQQMQLQMRAGE